MGKSENLGGINPRPFEGKCFCYYFKKNLVGGIAPLLPTALDVRLGAMNRGKILFLSNLSESETCSL